MDALTIRRYKGMSTPQYQGTARAEKPSAAGQSQKAARSTGLAVSETLRQLMSRVSQMESHIRESRRTLQSGETVLDEVRSSLDRIGELAKEAAGGGEPDRAVLQKEVERLRGEIGRMLSSAIAGDMPLFLDSDEETGIAEELEALLQAVMDGTQDKEGEQVLPDWLVKGITMAAPSAGQMLASLGLDKNASGAELLAAIADHPPESNSTTAYLATLYLGMVIAGGDPAGGLDRQQALEGLRKLLEEVQDGIPLDEAIELLTDGAFTGMADFQAQFTSGTAPGLEQFLMNLLLTSGDVPVLPELPIADLMGGLAGIKMELLLTLLDGLQSSGENATGTDAPASGGETASLSADGASAAAPPASTAVLQFGTIQVMGRDLSGVSFETSSGLLTVSGMVDVTIRGAGQGDPAILLTGSGTVTLQGVHTPTLTVGTAMARVFSTGDTVLHEVRMQEGASLTLSSGGRLEIGILHGSRSSALHLTGGAVIMPGKAGEAFGTLSVPVFLDGAVSLAADAAHVSGSSGKSLEPFDIIWKALLPGWNSITSMVIDGRQAKMSLLGGETPDPVRLWLSKDDGSHGYPVHTVVIRGRDRGRQPQIRYAFLRWDQQTGTFQEMGMYPNPFTVTGGKEHVDWIYNEMTQTLRILSRQVTAISGGLGTDAEQAPFSGRIALADHIGAIQLALNGVVCQVSTGRAFSLGRENDVTLILQSGAENFFQSGSGCAGISLRESTALCIDCAALHSSRDPAGTLTATGGAGGAGIGRDCGGSKDRTSQILIRGGIITATGTEGGAGIGAGKHGYMGPIVITGGTVTATGGAGGGAGIGGALGAPAGDISITGGKITAVAIGHAAAIGAGMRGASGDISITGSTRILKALGGDPGADIGGSLFGGCGNVNISGSADIGCVRLSQRSGVPLRMGETTVTLPQFRLSPRTLRLDRLNVLTREYAQAAVKTIDTDRRWIAQIQSVYSALYTQLEQSRLRNTRQYVNAPMVRDSGTASSLLQDMSRSIPVQAMSTYGKRDMDDVRRLLR